MKTTHLAARGRRVLRRLLLDGILPAVAGTLLVLGVATLLLGPLPDVALATWALVGLSWKRLRRRLGDTMPRLTRELCLFPSTPIVFCIQCALDRHLDNAGSAVVLLLCLVPLTVAVASNDFPRAVARWARRRARK